MEGPKGIGIKNPDKPIWRIFNLEHLYSLYKTKQLVLVNPALWDDPFDNVLQKCKIEIGPDLQISLRRHFDEFFGQCWTHARQESDAMWRIYSPRDGHGVRVQTTPRRLLHALASSPDATAENCFIGKVRYLTEKSILKHLSHPQILNDIAYKIVGAVFQRTELTKTMPAVIDTLLMKRKAFRYEEEVRLLYRERQQTGTQLRQFTVDTQMLFVDAVFDPRMTSEEYEKAVRQLFDLGYVGNASCSSLYQLPDYIIRVPKPKSAN